MTNEELASSYLAQARLIFREAEEDYRQRAWNLVVRRSQEAVELALKGALRFLGLEVPHVHDVGGILAKYRERFPAEILKELDRFISISRRLSQERGPSLYGDEEIGIPAERLYTQFDADSALRDAKFVLDVSARVLEGAK